jgi:phage terminase small subunit
MDTGDKKLNDRQRLFVAEYLKDFNATRSAIAAGYSPKAARAVSSRLLTNANIKAEIDAKKTKLFFDKENIIRENLEFWREVRAESDQETKDRLKASEYLGKFAGMFVDRVDLSGGVKIVIDNDDASLV